LDTHLNNMKINEYFKTPIWSEQKPEFLKSLNKASNKYIKTSIAKNKKYFVSSNHSISLTKDNDFRDFKKYVGDKSWEFLDHHGYDMNQYEIMFTELWVQEFNKKGGGHQSAHVHPNQHVSGFYFLKASEKTSMPVFHDPRNGARATKLKLKPKIKEIVNGTELVHYRPQPGTLLIFPGYLEHEFVVDFGIEPFRFIHWNIQAIPNEMIKDV
tara:strand:+ start:1782 stop:2417 length:636 start_codon:yes stop_codon:yes gene_type:complete